MDRKQYDKQNAEKTKRQERDQGCCCACCLQSWVMSMYNARQTYVHCEVSFSIGPESINCLAYGVFAKEGVMEMKRTFSNPAYHWVYLSISHKEYLTAKAFCQRQVGKPFNAEATCWRLMVWPPKSDGKKWWCASFVHAVLKKIGLLLSYPINTLDVDDIVRLVSKSNRRIKIGASPLELKNFSRTCGSDMFGAKEDGYHGSRGYFKGGLSSCEQK